MAVERARCPNCGYQLVKFRTDRRRTRHRAVELEWMICMRCRHVALESWSFADEQMSGRSSPRQHGDRKRA